MTTHTLTLYPVAGPNMRWVFLPCCQLGGAIQLTPRKAFTINAAGPEKFLLLAYAL